MCYTLVGVITVRTVYVRDLTVFKNAHNFFLKYFITIYVSDIHVQK